MADGRQQTADRRQQTADSRQDASGTAGYAMSLSARNWSITMSTEAEKRCLRGFNEISKKIQNRKA
jgi:hypothetical protein